MELICTWVLIVVLVIMPFLKSDKHQEKWILIIGALLSLISLIKNA